MLSEPVECCCKFSNTLHLETCFTATIFPKHFFFFFLRKRRYLDNSMLVEVVKTEEAVDG